MHPPLLSAQAEIRNLVKLEKTRSPELYSIDVRRLGVYRRHAPLSTTKNGKRNEDPPTRC